jgi:hypothetical protein
MKINTKTREKLPRFNHYVPKFILDNFADNGMLSILDKHTLRQFKLPPYRAMGEKDFTNVRIGDEVLSFENKFTYIEDQAAPVIAQVVQRRSLASLRPMDEAILHTFVVVQLLRSKRRRLALRLKVLLWGKRSTEYMPGLMIEPQSGESSSLK